MRKPFLSSPTLTRRVSSPTTSCTSVSLRLTRQTSKSWHQVHFRIPSFVVLVDIKPVCLIVYELDDDNSRSSLFSNKILREDSVASVSRKFKQKFPCRKHFDIHAVFLNDAFFVFGDDNKTMGIFVDMRELNQITHFAWIRVFGKRIGNLYGKSFVWNIEININAVF